MDTPDLAVRAGAVVLLRLYDVAYAVDLATAEALWLRSAGIPGSRSQLSSASAKSVAFGVAPVRLELGTVVLHAEGRALNASIDARVYDFGVAALALRVAVTDSPWSDFVALCNAVDRAAGPASANPLWQEQLERLRRTLDGALLRPNSSSLQEDYLVAGVQQWSEPTTAKSLLERVDLAPLLSGEQRPLSEAARRSLLSHRFSYFEDDLVVLTWDRAFVYEPRNDTDVADVLEVANAQLLELRYYDELLDAELPRMYDLVEDTRRTLYVFAPRRLAGLARTLYALVAEVTELTEKVDNALKVTEDVYLARVYSAALDLFRVPTFGAAVDRKLAIIRDTYTALYDEAFGRRGEIIELAIVLLILVELVIAVLHR
jgi:hypothetical protein